MNERYEKLFAQAWIEFAPGHKAVLERFAELIVAECIGKIELEAVQYAEPVWAFEIVNDIREHFGVDE